MSDLSGNNYRLICPVCKKDFLTKSFSEHLLNYHKEYIFANKNNKKNLEDYTKKKAVYSSCDYMEVEIDKKIQFFVPCCSKFYTKSGSATNHLKSKECKQKAIANAKNLLDSIISQIVINTPITIDISGNNNSHNTIAPNITNNITISIDETLLEKLLRTIIVDKDIESEERAKYYKKYMKLKEYLRDRYDDDCDSMVSDVKGYYSDNELDSDADTERMKKYYDISKENKTLMSKMNKDYSRNKLNLSTKEADLKQEEEDRELRDAEEAFQREQEENERLEKIGNLRSEIKSYKDMIKRHENSHKENLSIMKMEGSGITQEIFDKEYCQLKKIDKYKKLLEEVQSKLAKFL